MKMNLPNKLSMIRIFLIPVILVLGIIESINFNGNVLKNELFMGVTLGNILILVVFALASFTDFLDGHIARKNNLVTDFGKFIDPLADKLLVCSALICLIPSGKLATWIVLVIIAREFIISGFRLVASDNGIVIAASYWGKFKTVFQMVMICLMIADIAQLAIVTLVVMYIALALTVISLVDYLIKNKDVMKDTK